ncbi:membrane protein BRI3 isoform X1 [Bombus vancouverensis nearcticus]|uniref:Membrane protein BRI3 n=1 Tax=Bombus bifarius TaxID=103933 RepID=A0A6P8N6H8_9HYME|nr:brain protein I3 isoform X1 [Bombus vancouverensis nearcticus]XP_033198434.1 brain protein I3 isoform X1 [Bombus vancouverensis nearcticus]XP_033316098.1 brain protein I3 isoform X1 [Bombus bifarius]XP_033316099.1 brain protein I3 isoform X1 [Bombus bifarius]
MEKQPLITGNDKPPSYAAATAPITNSSWQPHPGYNATQCAGSTSWPPPAGYYPSASGTNNHNYVPSYGSTQSTTILMPEIILVGGCPACRVGVMEDDFTCLGLLCAILFFPLGIICCLLLKTRRCSNCGAYFG